MKRSTPGLQANGGRECHGTGGRSSAIGTGGAASPSARTRADYFNHEGGGPRGGKSITDQVVHDRDQREAVRRDQTGATGDELFIGREGVHIRANVAGEGASAWSIEQSLVGAGVGEVDRRIAYIQVSSVAHLKYTPFC